MEVTYFRRTGLLTGILMLLLAFVGLMMNSGLTGSWIRALKPKLTYSTLGSVHHAPHCCLPLNGRPLTDRPQSATRQSTTIQSPTPAVDVSASVKATSVTSSWPDCSVPVSPSSAGVQTTAGGCQLNDTRNFLYGHDLKGASAPEILTKCDVVPANLIGPIRVFECKACIIDLEGLDFRVELGGHYRPRHCAPRASAAIIIPFRNRWGHLSEFLLNMHPLLQKQELEYTIYIVNQLEGSKFNRGMLFNVGAVETAKIRNYTCYIFHDVDLLTENDKNLYQCPTGFHHYSVAVDKFNYRLPYEGIVGGVLAADKGAFEKVNGYSNLFFGWGGEDDDFSARITSSGFRIERFSAEVSRYKMIKHGLDQGNEVNPERWELLQKTSSRIRTDGLNSLTYKVADIKYAKLFTVMNVAISQQDVMNKFSGVAARKIARR